MRLGKKQTAGLNNASILHQKRNNRRAREKEGKTMPQIEIPFKPIEEPFTYIMREKPLEKRITHRDRGGNTEKDKRNAGRGNHPGNNSREFHLVQKRTSSLKHYHPSNPSNSHSLHLSKSLS
ncbi:hypothetical protein ACFX11_014071 [Malus domestica]